MLAELRERKILVNDAIAALERLIQMLADPEDSTKVRRMPMRRRFFPEASRPEFPPARDGLRIRNVNLCVD